jgi:hypothetical protein
LRNEWRNGQKSQHGEDAASVHSVLLGYDLRRLGRRLGASVTRFAEPVVRFLAATIDAWRYRMMTAGWRALPRP